MSDISTPSAMPKRASFITVNSTNQFNTQAVFEDHIRSSLNQAKEYHEFVYTDVPDPWGEVVPEIIDERISTHNAHVDSQLYRAMDFAAGETMAHRWPYNSSGIRNTTPGNKY
ncbi:hypothetical protein N7528_005814 [Penicillium herquei]|nr:hypothetical protein N7528_005814 [Penicillium herquei]